MKRADFDRAVDEHMAINAARVISASKGVVERPYVNVTLVGPCAKGKRCPKVKGVALVDTGARNAYIEPSAVRKLKLKSGGHGAVRVGLGNPKQTLNKYPVTLTFPGTDLPDVPLLKSGAYAKASGVTGRVASLGVEALAGGDGAQGLSLAFDAASGEFELRPSKARKRRAGGKGRRRR